MQTDRRYSRDYATVDSDEHQPALTRGPLDCTVVVFGMYCVLSCFSVLVCPDSLHLSIHSETTMLGDESRMRRHTGGPSGSANILWWRIFGCCCARNVFSKGQVALRVCSAPLRLAQGVPFWIIDWCECRLHYIIRMNFRHWAVNLSRTHCSFIVQLIH